MNNAAYYERQAQSTEKPKLPPPADSKSHRIIIAAVLMVLAGAAAFAAQNFWPSVPPAGPEAQAHYSLSGTVKKINSSEITIQATKTDTQDGQVFVNHEDRKILILPSTEILRLETDENGQISFTPATIKDIVFGLKVVVSAAANDSEVRAEKVIISR